MQATQQEAVKPVLEEVFEEQLARINRTNGPICTDRGLDTKRQPSSTPLARVAFLHVASALASIRAFACGMSNPEVCKFTVGVL